MIRQKLNEDWIFKAGADNPLMEAVMNSEHAAKLIQLPHDAMIHETRSKEVANGSQTGFYPGGNYTYIKKIAVPEEWENQSITFEFEGVYSNTKVFINDVYAGGCNNGYRNFYINANMYLKYGEENELKVAVNNTALPNSRWYSGSGIYRDVNILRSDLLHIAIDGVKITTPEIDADFAVVVVETTLENEHRIPKTVKITTDILDADNHVVASETKKVTVFEEDTTVIQRIALKKPILWDIDTPYLYKTRIRIEQDGSLLDEELVSLGIRDLKLDATNGLRLNGKTIKLQGCCIHHDNGVIGAATFYRAEERRCVLLKGAGFNCIRSAHQPISKAMLDACDKHGMLVIDELSDVWNVCKNHNDYSTFFSDNWEEDVDSMVAKDINHPSVIMYCLGNELSEAGTAKGAELNRKINKRIKDLDGARFTVNAINGLTAASKKLPLIFQDIAQSALDSGISSQADSSDTDAAGSNQVNNMMAMLVGPLADNVANHPIMSDTIEEFLEGTDVAGLNYMTSRHTLDPNCIVLGTETFPSEIPRLWNIVKENNNVLGDLTWTGFDYLGEAGIGNFYYDDSRPFSNHWPDLTAYCGDIDIIGTRRVISYYREVIFGLRKKPFISVARLNRFGMPCIKTPWAFKDNIESWTWSGYEGKPTIIDVYSDANEVELFLNGESLGRKNVGEREPFTASFETLYQPGCLKAVCYRDGKASETEELCTANPEVELLVEPDRNELEATGADLAYVKISVVDESGTLNHQAEAEVTIEIDGPGVIQGFGSGNPQTENFFGNNTWKTYDGHLLAVVRSTNESGTIDIVVKSGKDEKKVSIVTSKKGI
ncbi:glycoside hydrolase family 2 TIM barrel-domain containing protein [Trichococcus alkaliphilus]|uniref:glycoside hydrolase family 2 TIM barrel-domain containing protein n=1 Tax=Trichococcus alkaliphilus TaxID=2052943 RepID=UPI000D0B7B6B|nr:glycoside hydrolase family 2 TIM barrel-domain containing protein [Trichococcus alkaliphilus]